MHQVTSVPKQQVISHHCCIRTAAAAFHRGVWERLKVTERQPWANYYCSNPLLSCVCVCAPVCVRVCEGAVVLSHLSTGTISPAQWSSTQLQEEGLLWRCMKQQPLQSLWFSGCNINTWQLVNWLDENAQYTLLHNIIETSISLFVPGVIVGNVRHWPTSTSFFFCGLGIISSDVGEVADNKNSFLDTQAGQSIHTKIKLTLIRHFFEAAAEFWIRINVSRENLHSGLKDSTTACDNSINVWIELRASESSISGFSRGSR